MQGEGGPHPGPSERPCPSPIRRSRRWERGGRGGVWRSSGLLRLNRWFAGSDCMEAAAALGPGILPAPGICTGRGSAHGYFGGAPDGLPWDRQHLASPVSPVGHPGIELDAQERAAAGSSPCLIPIQRLRKMGLFRDFGVLRLGFRRSRRYGCTGDTSGCGSAVVPR